MSLQLIDTHSHIYDPQFDADRDEAVARGPRRWGREDSAPGCGCRVLRGDVRSGAAVSGTVPADDGLHPTSVNDNPRWREDLEQVARYLAAPPEGIRFCGVGEVGLDLYWSRDFLSQQQQALRFQVELSLQYGLPLVIHTRDAWDEMCALLDAFRGRGVRGILHSFCGTADHYRALKAAGGFLFGIGGPVTYKSRRFPIRCAKSVVRSGARDRFALPAAVPYRGKRNRKRLRRTGRLRLAEIYGTTPEEVAAVTTRNARALFGERIS